MSRDDVDQLADMFGVDADTREQWAQWDAYWDALTPADRALEHRMMADYATENTPGHPTNCACEWCTAEIALPLENDGPVPF